MNELFLALMGLAGVGAMGYWWLRAKAAGPSWDSCVGCGSERLTWDYGEIEGEVDDIYTCQECGHVGGPGQEYRSRQEEVKSFDALPREKQWRAILEHWREAHHQLSLANDFRNMAGTGAGGEGGVGPSWPMMDLSGRFQFTRAMELFTRLVNLPGLLETVVEAVTGSEGRPDRTLEQSESMVEPFVEHLVMDLDSRRLELAHYRGELAWMGPRARGVLLTHVPGRVSVADVLELGDDLYEEAAMAVVEMLVTDYADASGFERALLTLLSARGEGLAEVLGDALARVGTLAALRALEDLPEVVTRGQRKHYKRASEKLRERLARFDGRLSIEAEETAESGALSHSAEAGEVSLVAEETPA